jgi:hypothetical protein
VQSSRSTLSTQRTALSDLSGKLAALSTKNAALRAQLGDTKSQLETAEKRLAAVDESADRARALAVRNRSEAQRAAERLGGAVDEQRTQVGALAATVDGVKAEVGANRSDIERALGSLGEQGGLTARNRDELDALKGMGSWDYFEFDLRKSKEFTRVEPLALRLNKTDDGHQRYTVMVVVGRQACGEEGQRAARACSVLHPGHAQRAGARGAGDPGRAHRGLCQQPQGRPAARVSRSGWRRVGHLSALEAKRR